MTEVGPSEYAGRFAAVLLCSASFPVVIVETGYGRKAETFAVAPITMLPSGTGIALLVLGVTTWYVTLYRFSTGSDDGSDRFR